MTRIARVVVPGLPHHVTQRGNRQAQVLFEDSDRRFYLKLVSEAARAASVEIWAYCLMPNHVHFIVVPGDEDGLRKTFAEAHRRYTAWINHRNGWTGHLWQGRFASTVMDEHHLLNAVRYVALNPVRAGLAAKASEWPWSSAQAHLAGSDDGVVTVRPMLDRVDSFADYLDEPPDEIAIRALRASYSTGRPIGARLWLQRLEADAGRSLAPGPRGRRPPERLG
jgi:putative transposase